MTEMVRHVRTTIRYDGPALSGHEMDVQDLAPALLALADIIQIANRKFNGDQASMRVLVNADVEQKCFMLDLSIVQSFIDQAKTFFGRDEVKTAKEIAEWIGIVGGTGLGLFPLIKLLNKKPDGETAIRIEHPTGNTVTIIGNGNTVVIPRETYELAQDNEVIARAKSVVKPLEKAGYNDLSFLQDGEPVFEISKTEAAGFMAFSPIAPEAEPAETTAVIEGTLKIKSAQYAGDAKWWFLWNGRSIDAEMAGEAAQWVKDFQNNKIYAPPNSVIHVTMKETAKLDANGERVGKPSYVVEQVHQVIPPPQQQRLL